MAEDKNNTTQQDSASLNKTSTRAKKGTAIPVLTLNEVIKIMNDLSERAIKNGTLQVLADVLDNSITSSTFDNKVIALKSYGVIEVSGSKEDGTFELPELGLGIAYPRNQQEKIDSIFRAFKTQPVLQKVWSDIRNRDYELEFLPNTVVSTGGVPEDRKKEWTTYFDEAIRSAKLIKQASSGKEIVLSEPPKIYGGSASENPKPHEEKPYIPPVPQSNAETFEKLSSALTGGMKLNVSAGDCFALVFMDGKLKESEAQQLRDFFAGVEFFIKSRTIKENGQS